MKQSLSHVGIIRVKPDGKCRNYLRLDGRKNHALCESKVIFVPIRRTFTHAQFLLTFAEKKNLTNQ